MNLEDQSLSELFKTADKIGAKRYHRLTETDFANYQEYAHWRYIHSSFESGTTEASKQWVLENSGAHCPICEAKYDWENSRTIDHKLPRSKYPWLSMSFENLWVICKECNREKSDKDWYEYELYLYKNYRHLYRNLRSHRPIKLLANLRDRH
ncbi:MAG: HNH endonuclease signature motif containing protein [Pseudanabaenaceae cyanobacterium bins.39]|nr:HNH endonuclease signature motif containing protein [Pseudanabaenaceae cyanobacterium bins.39]